MSDAATLTPLELSALLCSRVCHDVISPVGAITNGLEVLAEDDGEEMKQFAMELITKSATQASAKLQFARIAFGAAGSAGAEIDLGDARNVAEGYMAGEKANLTWEAERVLMPKNLVKLLLNLLVVSIGTVPRGGEIALTVEGPATNPSFRIVCSGPNARIPAGLLDLLAGSSGEHAIDAHVIQPVYTGMLARECGMTVEIVADGEDIVVSAGAKE
jgi:histidine phosphotransferase ChpT